jgi:hypothetical protein
MAQFWEKKVEPKVEQEIKKETPKEEEIDYTPKFPEPEEKVAEKVVDAIKEERKVERTVLVSELDAYVSELMKEGPQTIDEVPVSVREVEKDDIYNILELPQEVKKYEDKFSFCWVSKKKRSIDEYRSVLEFLFVNKRFFPDLPDRLFTANGSIERGDLILMFISKERAKALRDEPIKKSQERIANLPVQDLEKWQDRGKRYYKPDVGASEDSEEPSGRFLQVD